jgi:ABC-type transport system substrate-binding protein
VANYWDRVVNNRISRRRALALTGGTAAAAAFLAACGGGDSETTGAPKDSSGLLFEPVDETKQAKRGGTYFGLQGNVYVTHDPHRIGAHGAVAQRGFSQLLRISDGVLKNTDGTPQGDLAESWEMSPDRLTLTLKLDPGAGSAPVAPLNGRVFDADDVVFSWERFKATGTLRGDLSNEVSPGAPIVSLTAPDKRTIVIKLNEPNTTIYTLLAQQGLGSFWILPKEAADPSKLDIARTPLGSGPFYMIESSEVNLRWKKNPNFKRASLKNNEPYIEEVFEPVIPNVAQVSAQFRAGTIYEATNFPSGEIVGAKRENMDLLMYASDPPSDERVYFGHNAESPFRDERLRIAYYKCFDRDLYITAAYNTDIFAKEGLPVQEFWEGSFGRSTYDGWLLDPKSTKDYGDKQKNFVYDLAEAKKLVEAAGQRTPFEYIQNYSDETPTSFGPPIYRRTDILMNMLEESNVFKMRRRPLEWATEWTPQIRTSGGNFNGASWGPDTSFNLADPVAAAYYIYNPKGGYFEGGDATLEDMTLKARREFDTEKAKEIVKEIQRYDAGKMFNQKVGVAGGFRLVWPVVRNAYVFRGSTNWMDIRSGSGLKAFIDPTKPPLSRS